MLKHVKTRLEEVQQKIRNLLPEDAILVGHSLNFDLDALQVNTFAIGC
jgi:RNA exonuclease 1